MERRLDKLEAGGNGGSRRHREGLNDILRKSSRMIARVGFHGTSMRDLSRATGRSLAGLYHYFSNKEDLLFLINYHGFSTLNQTWERMSGSFTTPTERLYGFIYLHTHYYIANIDEMRVMNWGTQELELERAMTIKELKDAHTADARKIVKAAFRETTGASIAGKRLERQTYLLFGMMNWIFGWYSVDEHGNVDDLVKDIYRTFMHGMTREAQIEADIERTASVVKASFHTDVSMTMWNSESEHQTGRLT